MANHPGARVTVQPHLFLLAALCCCLIGAACGGDPIGAAADGAGVAPVAPPAAPTAPPLRGVVIADRSGSRATTSTPELTAAQLRPLLDALEARGGELAAGIICDASARVPLIRVLVDSPTEPPAAAPSDDPTSSFDRYDQARARGQALTGWRTKEAGRRAAAQAAIAGFEASVAALLAHPSTCKYSDVIGAVRRAGLFLNEPWTGSPGAAAPVPFALVVSDGRHTPKPVPEPPPALPGDTALVVVSGELTAGDLTEMSPQMFDSVDAAIRFLSR